MKPKYLLLPLIMMLMAWFAISNESTLVLPADADNTPSTEATTPIWDETVFNETTAKPATAKTEKKKPEESLSPIDRIKALTEKSDLQLALLDDHDNYTRYPPENRRFTSPNQDPITQRYAPDERTTLSEDKNFGLTIWSDKKYYLNTDQVNIFAYVTDGEGKKIKANFSADIEAFRQRIGKLELADEDQDFTYQATINLADSSSSISEPGIYKVVIQDEAHEILDALTFTLSQPDIELTGEYRDKITSKGDLLIEAEVKVAQTNKFYIQASLYSSTNVPVGVTQQTKELSSGTHWIPLEFAGLMVRDSQESGPYVLQQLSLAKVTMPMQRAPVEQPGYQTDAYALDEFSDQPYQEQDALSN
ncbi:DUF4785 family immunoglobulin-like domain-containing protein [Litoribrevibacter albus]|uniref:DUF4785 domain-containing protein n=1 Tax=Litoribrevibacter albus TaxID=1473156 RepID=A0AA37SBC1_9GAMM|nr:hypothetical protein [Litoribrevibacter albus]GLQ31549.1 hypothetical protein GCM10007876_20280 [Litoribrevibacter albus]